MSSGDLRAYMRQLAGGVWDRQEEAFSFGLSLQEETITETLPLEMAKTLGAHGLKVKMFTRPEEGGRTSKYAPRKPGTGADWEWFYEGPPCMASFRVQAKRLYEAPGKKGEYTGFDPKGHQIDDLIKGAHGMNAVYVLYNHAQVADHDLFDPSGPPDHFGRSCWGCAATTAAFMKSVPDAKLATVIPGMVPWHKFFGLAGTCLPKDAFKKANQAIYSEEEGQPFVPAKKRPEWVSALIESADERVDAYIRQQRLAGVAYFSLEEG